MKLWKHVIAMCNPVIFLELFGFQKILVLYENEIQLCQKYKLYFCIHHYPLGEVSAAGYCNLVYNQYIFFSI